MVGREEEEEGRGKGRKGEERRGGQWFIQGDRETCPLAGGLAIEVLVHLTSVMSL